MMVIVGAQSPQGRALVQKLNEQNFNYLVVADDSPSPVPWPDETRFWHQISNTEVVSWVEENAEEIEFILCCNSLTNQAESDRFASLWNLGSQHQIPVIGISYSSEAAKEIITSGPPPFFWTILLTKNPQTEPEVSNITQAMYYYIRNRQNSGIRTLGEVPIE